MSPFSMPVLAGAAVLSSPALYRAFVEGSGSVEMALTRYLVAVAVCWALLALVVALVGPAPQAAAAAAPAGDDEAPEVATAKAPARA
jgi:hypothetical protein